MKATEANVRQTSIPKPDSSGTFDSASHSWVSGSKAKMLGRTRKKAGGSKKGSSSSANWGAVKPRSSSERSDARGQTYAEKLHTAGCDVIPPHYK